MGDDDGTAVGGQPFGGHTLLVRKRFDGVEFPD